MTTKIIVYLTKVRNSGRDTFYVLKCKNESYPISLVYEVLPNPETDEGTYQSMVKVFGKALRASAEKSKSFFLPKGAIKLIFNQEFSGSGIITFDGENAELGEQEYEIPLDPKEMTFFLEIFRKLRTLEKYGDQKEIEN